MRTASALSIVLATIFAISLFFMSTRSSIDNTITGSSGQYDPWKDINDDGYIELMDFYELSQIYGTSGDPIIAKAAILYDSGWINITDKCGQYFNVTHGLSSTDMLVDLTGKSTADGGTHQRYLGGTDYVPGWTRTYGGRGNDAGYCVAQTSDGGYVTAGRTNSFGAGNDDFWLVKLDANRIMEWNKTYGGTNDDCANSVIQTSEGGYAIVGYTNSTGAGNFDFWLVKVDSSGNMQWNETYGGTDRDLSSSLVQTADGGYAIAGHTWSFGAGNSDFWLVKVDSAGSMQWNKTYGGTGFEYCGSSLVQAGDGGFLMAGMTSSLGAEQEFWLIKTDASGNEEWNRTYGGISSYDGASYMIQTSDGGYALAGYTYTDPNGADRDFLMVKTDASGNAQWSKTYGGANVEWATSLVQTSDGGYAIAGYTTSFGGGGLDFWLVKTDAEGNAQWSQTYGGTLNDAASIMTKTADGGFAIVGFTYSFAIGDSDLWLVKTDSEGNMQWVGDWFKHGLAWTNSTADNITLYRGSIDAYWNFVRVRIWKIKESP